MSHFTVMVIGEDPESQLAKFDENIVVPRYVQYTKEQLIKKGREEIEAYAKSTYAEFLADPEKYRRESHNQKHVEYVEKEFPLRLTWTDEEIYQHEIRFYEPENIGSDGEVYSEYNPDSKWDWYQLGGRWSGLIVLKPKAKGKRGEGSLVAENTPGIDQARKGDIANFAELSTFAIVKDSKWHEKGQMGWWGMVNGEKAEQDWQNEKTQLLADLPDDTLISIFDCHI